MARRSCGVGVRGRGSKPCRDQQHPRPAVPLGRVEMALLQVERWPPQAVLLGPGHMRKWITGLSSGAAPNRSPTVNSLPYREDIGVHLVGRTKVQVRTNPFGQAPAFSIGSPVRVPKYCCSACGDSNHLNENCKFAAREIFPDCVPYAI
jgi:hypothetical protein